MYTLHLALASLLVGIVVADNPGIPSCAWDCVTGFGGCGQFDYECICSNTEYIAQMACCVSKSCDAADQEATLEFANALCAGQQVTNLPQTATCASTAASSSPTDAAATTGSTSGSTSGPSTTSATTTTNTAAAATSASAAASSSSPGAAMMNKIDGLGIGAVIAGLAVAL